jgi:hypothetical protein
VPESVTASHTPSKGHYAKLSSSELDNEPVRRRGSREGGGGAGGELELPSLSHIQSPPAAAAAADTHSTPLGGVGRKIHKYRQDSIPRSNDDELGHGGVEGSMVDIDDLPDNIEEEEDEMDVLEMQQHAAEVPLPRRGRRSSFNEVDFHRQNPIRGQLLTYFMESLDKIVNEPFLYFAKRPDPVSLHLAMEYIANNEQSDTIFIVHFADDRDICMKSMKEAGLKNTVSAANATNAVSLSEAESTAVEQEHTHGHEGESHQMLNEDEVQFREILLRNMSIPTFHLPPHLTTAHDDDMSNKANGNERERDRDGDGDGEEEMYLYESQGMKLRCALPVDARKLVDYVSILDTFYT